MKTVEITRKSSGFCNVPASFSIGDCDDGGDCHVSVATYYLPDGYSIGLTTFNELAIFDQHGHYCEIIEHPSGRPQLVADDPYAMPVLEKLQAGDAGAVS